MRIKLWTALAVAGGLAMAASQAQATTFAGSWTLDYNSSDPGLVIQILPINQSFSFTLAPDDPSTVGVNEEVAVIPLFKIYTSETSVNAGGRGGADDIVPKPITLTFSFDQPTPNDVGPVVGITGGINLLLFQKGYLDWDTSNFFNTGGETDLNFGVGNPRGLLSIGVNGGLFNAGFLGLSPGEDKGLVVYGTFDWDRDAPAAAVPEPATWALMIGGFGLAGAALRRRRALAA